MFKINQRVKWTGPGEESFGTVTDHLTSAAGFRFVCVRWDGEKGSDQYAELTAEKYMEAICVKRMVSASDAAVTDGLRLQTATELNVPIAESCEHSQLVEIPATPFVECGKCGAFL